MRGEDGGEDTELLITLYVHCTIFLVMLFNIKLLRIKFLGGGGGGDTLVFVCVDSLGNFGLAEVAMP